MDTNDNNNVFPDIKFDGKSININDLRTSQDALIAYESKNYAKALDIYTKLINANPNAHQYYQFRGTVYEDMGDDAKAQLDFEKSIALDPENTTSLYRLAMVYHRKGDLDTAIVYLKKAYDLLSEYDGVLGKEFSYQDLMGNSYNNILMVHKRVIAFNLALFLVQTNKIEEGMVLLDELIQHCPTYSYPYYVKALVYEENQKINDALELAQKAAEFGHPQAQSLIDRLHMKDFQHLSNGDKYVMMIKSASSNPFNISCDPALQNPQPLPDLTVHFVNDLNIIVSSVSHKSNEALEKNALSYVCDLIDSYYKNAGYVPKNTLDQVLLQVYEAIRQTVFSNVFKCFDDFKIKCYLKLLRL